VLHAFNWNMHGTDACVHACVRAWGRHQMAASADMRKGLNPVAFPSVDCETVSHISR
jgi:hypothetical protein